MFTSEDLEVWMEALQKEEKEIRQDRGKRYGNEKDTLANVAEFGPDGVISGGFWECVMRIRNMYGKQKDKEDLKNAIQDLRNFTAYIFILEYRDEEN